MFVCSRSSSDDCGIGEFGKLDGSYVYCCVIVVDENGICGSKIGVG